MLCSSAGYADDDGGMAQAGLMPTENTISFNVRHDLVPIISGRGFLDKEVSSKCDSFGLVYII